MTRRRATPDRCPECGYVGAGRMHDNDAPIIPTAHNHRGEKEVVGRRLDDFELPGVGRPARANAGFLRPLRGLGKRGRWGGGRRVHTACAVGYILAPLRGWDGRARRAADFRICDSSRDRLPLTTFFFAPSRS